MNNQQDSYFFESPFGKIKGKTKGGTIRFGSIRYAASERFQLPVAVHPKDSFQKISEKPVACPQQIYPLLEKMIEKSNPENFEVNESNQFLTIYVPKNFEKKKNISIIVWIHGGSYEIGCGDLPTSDPSQWVEEQEIIIVTVSYRLGIFGFLGGFDKRPANLGLFDIIEALKWVKNYSQIFNGDASKVTLIGQSSGGDAIAHLMIADLPENLFQRAIIQSAPLLFRKKRFKMSRQLSDSTMNNLEYQDPLKITEIKENLLPTFRKHGWKSLMPFGLQYGKAPLPAENEAEILWREKAKDFDVLIGYNADETSFYIATTDTFKKYEKNRFSRHLLRQMIKYSTNKIYGKPSRDFAKMLANAGGNVTHFKLQSSEKFNEVGVSHCFDLPLLFGNEQVWKNAGVLKNVPWNFMEENGKKLRAVWTEFATTGKISTENMPPIIEISKL